MTKSDYIRKRIQPIVRMIKPFVHEEMRDSVELKVENWALRLITDIESLVKTDVADMPDLPYTEDL